MSRDGSGNYLLPAGQPVVTGTNIDSSVFNTLVADIQAALTQSIAKDGQTTPTANLPMGNNKHTSVADANQGNQYASAKQVQNGSLSTAGGVSNVGDAYAASLSPSIALYTDGMPVSFTPSATNTTTSPTLALNGLGAKPITKEGNVACVAGDIVANVPADLLYTSRGGGAFILLNPQKITGSRISGLPDSALSSNVPLKNTNNAFTKSQSIAADSGIGLTVTGIASQYTGWFQGSATTGQSLGLGVQAGTNASDTAFYVRKFDGSQNYFTIRGDGIFTFNFGGSFGGIISGTGVNAAGAGVRFYSNETGTSSSGVELAVNGTTKGYLLAAAVNNIPITGSLAGDLNLRTNGTNFLASVDSGSHIHLKLKSADGVLQIADTLTSGNLFDVGYRDLPVVSVGTITLDISHRGKMVYANAGGITITIPSNASVPYPVGSTIVIDNDNASSITLAINSDTMRQVGTGASGTRTIGANGQAVIVKVAATTWRVSGVNLS